MAARRPRRSGPILTRTALVLILANEARGLVSVALLGPTLLDWLR